MARTSRGSFRARSPRRRTGWEEGPGTQAINGQSSSFAAIIGGGQSALVDGMTVARIRGQIEVYLTAVTAAGDGYAGAFGIGIVTAAAFAVGVTAVPTPITEIEWEGWLWHQFFSLHVGDKTAGDVDHSRLQIPVDTKAMRKIGSDEVVFLSWEATEEGTATIEAVGGSRMLVMLP